LLSINGFLGRFIKNTNIQQFSILTTIKVKNKIVSFEQVRDKIVNIRGQQVIPDFAVAELYGVETREINQAVKNNPRKFPKGWLLVLDNQESAFLRSKFLMLEKNGAKQKV